MSSMVSSVVFFVMFSMMPSVVVLNIKLFLSKKSVTMVAEMFTILAGLNAERNAHAGPQSEYE
jgi:hypothetical protein